MEIESHSKTLTHSDRNKFMIDKNYKVYPLAIFRNSCWIAELRKTWELLHFCASITYFLDARLTDMIYMSDLFFFIFFCFWGSGQKWSMLDYTAFNIKFMKLINLKCFLNEKYVSNLATKGEENKNALNIY